MGNTFDVNTVKYGHARKVWREIRHRYPGGGMVSNISDWVAVGKIPAGTAVKFDLSGKTFKAYTDEQIKAAESDITTLGINGYLQEDVLVASENTKASGTVVYAGEIYQYMFDEKWLLSCKDYYTSSNCMGAVEEFEITFKTRQLYEYTSY